MNLVLQSSIKTLQKSSDLLDFLTDKQLSNHSVSPYYSCIGSHIRHIVDFYNCIFVGLDKAMIDLTGRARDERMHSDCSYAVNHVSQVISKLKALQDKPLNLPLVVYDDLGLGKVAIDYTLGGLLAQANSHAIHHYAIISYILDRLGITIKDESFGYNPTTPKPQVNLN